MTTPTVGRPRYVTRTRGDGIFKAWDVYADDRGTRVLVGLVYEVTHRNYRVSLTDDLGRVRHDFYVGRVTVDEAARLAYEGRRG